MCSFGVSCSRPTPEKHPRRYAKDRTKILGERRTWRKTARKNTSINQRALTPTQTDRHAHTHTHTTHTRQSTSRALFDRSTPLSSPCDSTAARVHKTKWQYYLNLQVCALLLFTMSADSPTRVLRISTLLVFILLGPTTRRPDGSTHQRACAWTIC